MLNVEIIQTFDTARVSNYSHSTIYVTNTSTITYMNVPQLTSLWTAPGGCKDRWMGGGEGTQYIVNGSVSDFATDEPLGGDIQSFVAFSTNPSVQSFDSLYDRLYSSCQPYQSAYHYSPGICPEGHTMAEITEFHYATTSSSFITYFQGSCCMPDMTFRLEDEHRCVSNISTLLEVHVPFTTISLISYNRSVQSGSPVTAFEYLLSSYVSEGYGSNGWNTTTFSNISTATAGLVAADPIVVVWQERDLSVFPTDYLSSLAQRYNTNWNSASSSSPADPTPASTSSMPRNTNQTAESLGKGAKAGIGAGIAVGVAFLIAATIVILLRTRRNRQAVYEEPQSSAAEVEDQERKEMPAESNPQELKYEDIKEMPGHQPQELDSRTVAVITGPSTELDGSAIPPRGTST